MWRRPLGIPATEQLVLLGQAVGGARRIAVGTDGVGAAPGPPAERLQKCCKLADAIEEMVTAGVECPVRDAAWQLL